MTFPTPRAGFTRKKRSLSTRFSLIHSLVMNLKSFETMDPQLLVGLINTELRNNASSLDDLCKTHGLDEKSVTDCLANADYHFSKEAGQFR